MTRNNQAHKLFGALAILLALGIVIIIEPAATYRLGEEAAHNRWRVYAFAAASLIVGGGLFYQKRWAALIFSLGLAGFATFAVIAHPLNELPPSAMLLNGVLILLMFVPLIWTIHSWSSLK